MHGDATLEAQQLIISFESTSAGWGGGKLHSREIPSVGSTPLTLGGKQANIHGVTGSCCFAVVLLLTTNTLSQCIFLLFLSYAKC